MGGMGSGLSLPLLGLWAQASGSAPTASNPTSLAPLVLRRWCASLTLSSPGNVPGAWGLWAWLAGLGALLLIAVVFQGPGRALRQLVDVAGHIKLIVDATRRTRRAARMLAVVIGMTVLSWSGSQVVTFRQDSAREDLLLLKRTRGTVELALEQGVLAGLTPFRDVAGLASNLPLLTLATVLLFRATAESWGAGATDLATYHAPRPPAWTSVAWACGALFVLYRMVALAGGSPELPLGGCLTVEGLVVPVVMLVADGILLGWILAELRHAGFEAPEGTLFNVREAAGLMPGAALACLAALPARYMATCVFLSAAYLPNSAVDLPIGRWVRWQLGWGLADLQGAALVVAGLVGAVAWTRGSPGEAVRGYARMLRTEGARLTVVLMIGGLGAVVAAVLAYLAVLSLPSSTWLLNAADGYAHYVTLPFGLWTVAALVELAERSLPVATLALVEEPVAVASP